MRPVLSVLALTMLTTTAFAQVPASFYRVENVPTPRGIAPEVSAVTFGKDGLLYATFRQGYIYAHNPNSGQWRRFASGLHLPLGIIPGEEGEFFVAQMPELTRVADTDGDGEADVYEAISDDWGMSGNYHEFIGGPIRDAEGNFYIGLGLSSPNAEPRPPVRREFTGLGRITKNPVEGNVNTINFYSPTSYRGVSSGSARPGSSRPSHAAFGNRTGSASTPKARSSRRTIMAAGSARRRCTMSRKRRSTDIRLR